jgi:hypothetical protein
MRHTAVGFAAVLTLAGCLPHSDIKPPDDAGASAADLAAPSPASLRRCVALAEQATAALAAAQRCTFDSDCIRQTQAECTLPGVCGGAVLTLEHDQLLAASIDEWQADACGALLRLECLTPPCPVPLGHPACVQGLCSAALDDVDGGS